MKMSALKAMMMAGAIMVATCLTANAAPVKSSHTTQQDTTKKMKMKKGKKMKMKKDTTSNM